MKPLISGPVGLICLPREERDLAHASISALADFANQETEPLTLHLENGHTGHQVQATIPAEAVRVLAEVLEQMSRGHPVTLVPLEAEISTQQAADLLGVSRPYVVKLLEQGHIAFRRVGQQRRIRYTDLQCYVEVEKQVHHRALDEMTAESQRLGLYE